MSESTREMVGWDWLAYLVCHFKMSVSDALENMREHNQDMTFLKDDDAEDHTSRLVLIWFLHENETAITVPVLETFLQAIIKESI